MNFTKIACLFLFLLSSCSSKPGIKDYPPYKLLISFSEKIKPKTGLILSGYGINFGLPRDYQTKNGIGNFKVSYHLPKNKDDSISLEYARNLVVLLTEDLLNEINSNLDVKNDLDLYPFVSDLITLSVYFEDENRIELGQGIANFYSSNGKIKYECYKINKYTGQFPADGKHFIIHEESYAEALDIVKKQGPITYLDF